nr:MAG: ORF1 [Torque teno midi virus]
MPFWWRRRRKPWIGRWRRKRQTTRYKRRRFRRRRRRRAPRRRRRYRRKRKVRRKLQKIQLKQWQPDRIVRCKIKGLGCLVAGAQGRQYQCYTDDINEYPPPKTPGGGGFGVEVFTLQYLYEQWQARKNIWTRSNDYTDLCRYTGTKITIMRHPTTDFIVSYNRMPPFNLDKETYLTCHPVNMLLSKHHKVILSRASHPTGKSSVSFRIKPPKLMQTHWFFQKEFCTKELFELRATACNMGYSYYGPNTQSQLLTFYSLNVNFFVRHNWANPSVEGGHGYIPFPNYPQTQSVTYKYPTKTGTETYTMAHTVNYYDTINYDKGFFNWRVLTAIEVNSQPQGKQHEVPITVARYNPSIDTGKDTYVWLVSTISSSNWQTPKDNDLIIAGYPLWMALYGLWSYLVRKKDEQYVTTGMFVVKSPAIRLISKTVQTIFPIIDLTFIKGQMPWDQLLTEQDKKLWYPTALKQQQIINTFVESGPYIPKYSNLPSSTWNLTYRYTSYFKWGGPELTDQPVQDPCTKQEYDITDNIKGTLQIQDPFKQKYQQLLRAWDIRRGMFTKTAIKRMYQNLETDTSIHSDETESPKKKKRVTAQIKLPEEENKEINKALLSLCEENTCQEQDLQKLIQFQQQQQHNLRKDLINIILDLKNKQRVLQLQTGIF